MPPTGTANVGDTGAHDAHECIGSRDRARAAADALPSSSVVCAARADRAGIQKSAANDAVVDRVDALIAPSDTDADRSLLPFDDFFVHALDAATMYVEDAHTTGGALRTPLGDAQRRFCKSCRKSLDVCRDFDGALKTCRLCLRVRKKDAKRRRALRRKDASRGGRRGSEREVRVWTEGSLTSVTGSFIRYF